MGNSPSALCGSCPTDKPALPCDSARIAKEDPASKLGRASHPAAERTALPFPRATDEAILAVEARRVAVPEENVALPEGQPTSQDLAQQQELLRQQQHGLLQRMPLQSRPPAQAAWQTVKTSWLQNTPNTTVNSTSPTNALSPNASGESNAATAIGNDALLDHLALTDFAEVDGCTLSSLEEVSDGRHFVRYLSGPHEKDTYDGHFRNGVKHGYGVYSWASGDRYAGEYLDDFKHGRGVYTWANGRFCLAEYREGKRVATVATSHWLDGRWSLPTGTVVPPEYQELWHGLVAGGVLDGDGAQV